MKAVITCVLIFLWNSLIAQDTIIKITSSPVGINRVKERENKIAEYATRINNYTGGTLPDFLYDKCFDLQSNLWGGFHSSVSLRWKVLEKVDNREALRLILKKHTKKLKRRCSYDKGSTPEIAIPMIEKSFYQLIRERYKQLEK